MPDLSKMFADAVAADPRLSGNPDARAAQDAIERGDLQTLEQIGRGLCSRIGVSPQELLVQGLRRLGM